MLSRKTIHKTGLKKKKEKSMTQSVGSTKFKSLLPYSSVSILILVVKCRRAVFLLFSVIIKLTEKK